MSLVFAGIVPHPPLLIPNVGRQAGLKAKKTKQALEKLEEDLYVSKPELILIISPHGDVFPDSFNSALLERGHLKHDPPAFICHGFPADAILF